MHMRKVRLLPLILLTPIFLANSPAPYRGPSEYKDFNVANFSSAVYDAEKGINKYEFDLNNDGDGYIDLYYLEVTNSYIRPFDSPESAVVAPNKSTKITFYSTETITEENLVSRCLGYLSEELQEDVASFSQPTEFTKTVLVNSSSGESYYRYYLECDYEQHIDELGNHYSPIICFNDGTNDYYFHFSYLFKEAEFYTHFDMDVENITIKSYTFVKGYDYYRNNGGGNVSIVMSTFMWVLLSVFVFSVPVCLLIGGIVVLIVFLNKRKKNNRKPE